ncbi:hypothetical protein JVT61DRAFT_13910 [Boletus reticuloceps]|uniref:Uncharacterized protein n=1 Tax=Boletus reticuloceps TaxID=495285 RepID=A0A8I2YVP3_9AGAM|nr:hypothetical protein JVT61DRAFT_13910 [Boletus reticuloceps]
MTPPPPIPGNLSSLIIFPARGQFSTLVVSTGGHWTTTLMSAFRDEEAGEEAGYGIDRGCQGVLQGCDANVGGTGPRRN